MKKRIEDTKNKAIKAIEVVGILLIGAFILFAVQVSVKAYEKREALKIAWDHSEVLKDFKVSKSLVLKK